MPTLTCRRVIAAVVLTLIAWTVTPRAQETQNATAAAQLEFTKRLKAYMDIHNKEESQVPEVKKGATPAEVLAFEKTFAARIKAARVNAKQGDIFVPEVVPLFKSVFADYYKRRSGREIRLLFDEVPNFKPEVNMTYPVMAPKATFPPRLSLTLPTLMDEVEYRMVGTNLVLRDTEANIIVDYIPGVIPASAKK
jgi:hypothetical protein